MDIETAKLLIMLTVVLVIVCYAMLIRAFRSDIGERPRMTKRVEELLARAVADESLHRRLIEELEKKSQRLSAIAAVYGMLMLAFTFVDSFDLAVVGIVGVLGFWFIGIPTGRIYGQLWHLKDLRKRLDRW